MRMRMMMIGDEHKDEEVEEKDEEKDGEEAGTLRRRRISMRSPRRRQDRA